MTIDQVLDEARRMDPGQRAATWTGCGEHDVTNLLVAESVEGASWRYCEACWTAFDTTGSYAINAPAARTAGGDERTASRMPMYTVIANCEDEYSVWPLSIRVPPGWRSSGPIGTAAQCASYIKEMDREVSAAVLRRRLEREVVRP
jgi:MbtH protein